MKEVWKDINGYEGLYQVSNLGNIKSLKYNGGNKPKNIKATKTKAGYLCVGLYKNKKVKTFTVHRLVANTFILNKNNYTCVNHIDGNKSNNKISNLEWCSYTDNELHAYKNKLKKPHNKPIVQYDLHGNFIKEWESAYEAGRMLKLNISNINSCCRHRKHHSRVGNYKFEYKYKMELKEIQLGD